MIVQKHRFHGYGSLRYVYQHGKTERGSMFATKHCINPKRSEYRAAIVVSKKISKSAVVRNRIRRRLYEQIRLLSSQITQAHDIVVTVYNEDVATMPVDTLQQQLQQQFRSAGMLS